MTAHGALINMGEGQDIWKQGQNAVLPDAGTYTQFSGGIFIIRVWYWGRFKKWRHSITF